MLLGAGGLHTLDHCAHLLELHNVRVHKAPVIQDLPLHILGDLHTARQACRGLINDTVPIPQCLS